MKKLVDWLNTWTGLWTYFTVSVAVSLTLASYVMAVTW
jgi:hypothetical protein